ncbi:hypothetical protein FHT86_007744 [Rhizobium sp. BK313]|uniref:hypothetical protein n=1 Tax=Rhizobium sp. BK313 TaxID=2587081 RepID=UPI00105B5C94|nr:hypothetical protein [Rhizobium sp. BK313]MBB3459412.1 hypothetical protein [Rhizobium sp. BK313]
MENLFSGSGMRWSGTNLVGATDEQRKAYRCYLDDVELSALSGSPGATVSHRLEKMAQSPRRSFGPDFLSVFEFAATSDTSSLTPGGNQPWSDVFEAMWSMTWRKISDTGQVEAKPDRVRLLALSPPLDATEAEIADWNRFYTKVHVGEAMQRRRWTRATRWTLEHADLHPAPGCPRYFVLYEAVGFKDATDEEVAAWGPWTEGPPIWKRHVGAWTLDYRVIKPSS